MWKGFNPFEFANLTVYIKKHKYSSYESKLIQLKLNIRASDGDFTPPEVK